ncbi:7651_t:CDS:1, partial [Entrophospora sp. SA101]
KNTIIKDQEKKINELERKTLELLSRNMVIHEGNAIRLTQTSQDQAREIERLRLDNNRLRQNRDYYRTKRDEIKSEKDEVETGVNELMEILNNLKEQVARLKQENQQLKNKTENLMAVVRQE